TVTGTEAPGQDVVIQAYESLGLEPDVWEPSADELRDHPAFFETTSYSDVGYDGRPNVVARRPGSGDGPTLAVSGHIDVVPANADEWERDPWTLTREGDQLFGRGAADMKGGLAAAIVAVEALERQGVDLAGDLLLQSTIEEEDGGIGGLLSVLERGYVPDAAVIPEPFGIPDIGIASAGVMYFVLTVPGRSAHAAWAYDGVSAIHASIPLIEALDTLDRERKARISFEPAVREDPDLEGNVTNINLGMMEAGDWPSTVPAEATIRGRVGWPPGESRAEVRSQIEVAIDEAVSADDWLSSHPPRLEWVGWQAEPHHVAEDAEIVQLAKRVAEEVTGLEGQFIGGTAGLDERFYARYYDVPVATMGPLGERLHGADEYTTLSSLVETAQSIASVAMEYCGVADEQ
ncbi:MAG: ArgE/DapE family deacylase, partial [Halobacteriales archaeon]|nr:ArgE/DapE family deacylase [Halobacteriales archaeon]